MMTSLSEYILRMAKNRRNKGRIFANVGTHCKCGDTLLNSQVSQSVIPHLMRELGMARTVL